MPDNQGRRWTDQQILDAIQRWADEHGRPPKFNEWRRAGEGRPSAFTVHSRCGSWSQAMEMLGFETYASPRPKRLDRGDKRRALALRKKGFTNQEIAELLGFRESEVMKEIGRLPRERKPQNAEERREARIQALKKAIYKQELAGKGAR